MAVFRIKFRMSVGHAKVLYMGLDERVATLEREVSAIRTEDIPALRSDMEHQYRDLLTQIHGWGSIAVEAKNKVDNSSQLVNLIYQEVHEAKGGLQAVNVRLDVMDSRLNGIDVRLDAMDERFDGIDTRLDKMDIRLDGIDNRLDAMDKRFDGIDARLDGIDVRLDAMDKRFDGIDSRLDKMDGRIDAIDGTLADHGKLLLQILAKLS
jgi:archaellum component FlaC